LTRNAFANTEQRATLLGIGLYSEGNRPTQQKLCSAPTELLSLIAESPVRTTPLRETRSENKDPKREERGREREEGITIGKGEEERVEGGGLVDG
jgi:hypothetical protein